MNILDTHKRAKRLSENARRHIGETLTIRWGTSRGADSYGYTTCSLRNHRGERVAACNGGGYDMRGTVIGNWIAATFPKELRALRSEDMPAQSHWEPERARFCAGVCAALRAITLEPKPEQVKLPDDCFTCPTCGGETHASRDGKRIDDGRYFYGLRFYDPNYDALAGKLERADGTFTKPEDVGKTFRQLKAEGKFVDLDLMRSAYKQTSPHATARHTQPTIDGACGESSVRDILKAIGLELRKVVSSSKLDVYTIEAAPKERRASNL